MVYHTRIIITISFKWSENLDGGGWLFVPLSCMESFRKPVLTIFCLFKFKMLQFLSELHLCRGYMSLEYLVRGQLTGKADVYSFGILVIEVISGKRSRAYTAEESTLVHLGWNLYMSNRLSEAVDPALEGSYLGADASRVLQIGLLCT